MWRITWLKKLIFPILSMLPPSLTSSMIVVSSKCLILDPRHSLMEVGLPWLQAVVGGGSNLIGSQFLNREDS
jgi:hypothetical protein